MSISFSGLISTEPPVEYAGNTSAKSADAGETDFEALMPDGEDGIAQDPSMPEDEVDTEDMGVVEIEEGVSTGIETPEDPDNQEALESDDSTVDHGDGLVHDVSADNKMVVQTATSQSLYINLDNNRENSIAVPLPEGVKEDQSVDAVQEAIDDAAGLSDPVWDIRLSGPNDIQSFDASSAVPASVMMSAAQPAISGQVQELQSQDVAQVTVGDISIADIDPATDDAPAVQAVRSGDIEAEVSVDHRPLQSGVRSQNVQVTDDTPSVQGSSGGEFASLVEGEAVSANIVTRIEFASGKDVSQPRDVTTPQSPIVQKVTEQISKIPTENGTTTIRLKPHGMGAVEITVEKASNGRIEVDLKVQNPLVLEAMRSERGAIAHLFSSQANGGGGSLSMELMNSGNGQGKPARQEDSASRSGGDAEAASHEEDTAGQDKAQRTYAGPGTLNILT